MNWKNGKTWLKSAHNTKWCLLGCAIGDFATIAWFQVYSPTTAVWLVMSLAIMNGLLTSIALETVILCRQAFSFREAFKLAIGMSFISMVAMEASMNLTDYLLTGGALLTWWVIPIMLVMGFITPWPYNYWRLEKHGKSCH